MLECGLEGRNKGFTLGVILNTVSQIGIATQLVQLILEHCGVDVPHRTQIVGPVFLPLILQLVYPFQVFIVEQFDLFLDVFEPAHQPAKRSGNSES